MEGKAKQDFFETARDHVLRNSGSADEMELTVNFNDAAEFVEGAGEGGEEEDERARTWKQWAEERRRKGGV